MACLACAPSLLFGAGEREDRGLEIDLEEEGREAGVGRGSRCRSIM